MSTSLGIDLGNGKVKFCLVKYSPNDTPYIKWNSYTLPITNDRKADFKVGLPIRLNEFLEANNLTLENIDISIFCSSNAYSFNNFAECTFYNANLLEKVFSNNIFMISDDGNLYTPSEVNNSTGLFPYKFALTNFWGSSYLASHLIENGLSIDIGTTTTDIIPIHSHSIDPNGLNDSNPYVQHRYYTHKINWYGLTITPLYTITNTVKLNKKTYEVVTRNYFTDSIFAILFPQHKELISLHDYRNSFPSVSDARANLAQFIGLDPHLLKVKDIKKIAEYVYSKLVNIIAKKIKLVLKREFPNKDISNLEIALFALGQDMLAKPCVIKAGANPYKIKNLEIGKEFDLYSASSCYALAVKGLETIYGSKVVKELVK